MGGPKSGLRVGDEPLVQRQLRILREAGVAECWLSLGAAPVPGDPGGPNVRVVHDERPGLGPLAGIVRLLASAGCPLVLVLAVDLPAMTPNYLQGLIAQCRPGRGVVPVRGGRFEPLAAIYPTLALSEAADRLVSDRLALQPFAAALVSRGFLRVVEVHDPEEPLFLNWNHPGDYPG